MAMENINISRIKKIFFALTLLLSCFTMNTDKLHGYFSAQGTPFIMFRLALIFSFMLIATIICKDEIKFISKFEPIAIISITALLIFDYYVTEISGSQFLYKVWWMISIFTCELTLYMIITLSRAGKKDYALFNKRFWLGFTPLYIFILIICFVRNPSGHSLSINTHIGQGTIQMLIAFLNDINISFEAPLIFFGNLLIFLPLAFILKAFIVKSKQYFIVIIGTALPFIVEGYQYIFSCGDVDIDDIVLNLAGFYIGYCLSTIIYKKKLAE